MKLNQCEYAGMRGGKLWTACADEEPLNPGWWCSNCAISSIVNDAVIKEREACTNIVVDLACEAGDSASMQAFGWLNSAVDKLRARGGAKVEPS